MNDAYKILGWIAMGGTPLAPAVVMGNKTFSWLLSQGTSYVLAVLAAVGFALGLEAIGIIAGHVGLKYWRLRDFGRLKVTSLALVVYVAFGLSEFGLSIGGKAFLVAPLLYVVVAMLGDATGRVEILTQDDADEKAVARQIKLADNDAKNERLMVRTQAKAGSGPNGPNDLPNGPNDLPNTSPNAGSVKDRMRTNYRTGMGPTELARTSGGSKGYAAQVIKEITEQ